jgi:hypothetical protein
MDKLTLFGLVAVSLMLLFYAQEDRSPWCALGFAESCVLGSTYGFLQGAWPFGLVQRVWSLVALRRWWMLRRTQSRAEPCRAAVPRGVQP